MELPEPSKLGRFKSAPMTKSQELAAFLPKKTEEEEKKASIVFQGKQMREDASWLSKIFFSYSRPLLYSSLKEKISFDQYGVLPEHLKIKHEYEKLQKNMDYYVKKDPKDEYAVFKGVVATSYDRYALFLTCKMLLCSIGLYVPVLMKQFIEYVENED